MAGLARHFEATQTNLAAPIPESDVCADTGCLQLLEGGPGERASAGEVSTVLGASG